MTRLMSTILATLALGGCVTYHHPADGIVRTRIGQTARVDSLRITPMRVVSDSRCPQGVQCVWAGEVRLLTRIDSRVGRESRELVLGRAEAVAGGQLELVEVLPEATKDTRIDPNQYRFGFAFERRR